MPNAVVTSNLSKYEIKSKGELMYLYKTIFDDLYRYVEMPKSKKVLGVKEGGVYFDENYVTGMELAKVESFVSIVAQDKKPNINEYFEILDCRPENLPPEICLPNGYRSSGTGDFSEVLLVSEYVWLFFEQLRESEQYQQLKHMGVNCKKIQNEDMRGVVDAYDDLFVRVKERLNLKALKDKVRYRRLYAYRNASSAKGYIQRLLNRFQVLNVIRVDLGFELEYQVKQGVTLLQDNFKRFLNNRRGNKRFDNLVGYIWKLEYGYKKGFHYRCMFFFEEASSKKTEELFHDVGEYWKHVLKEGVGKYSDCSIQKGVFSKAGMGVVSKSDSKKASELHAAVNYLCGKDEFLRLNLQLVERKNGLRNKIRIFGKGGGLSACHRHS